jgi:NAD(P)H dehydrogenase (quinone)
LRVHDSLRIHVLFAHPSPTSFVGALHERVVATLRARGHEVDDLDLYAEGFNPVLTPETFRCYVDTKRNTAEVEDYVARLRAADALVLVYPVWFDGLPAILTGYFQRVFLPGVATVIDENGLFHANLHNLRRLGAVAVYGESRGDVEAKGDPPRRFVRDNIGVLIHPEGRFDYVAHYDMNFTRAESREAFLREVEAAFSDW